MQFGVQMEMCEKQIFVYVEIGGSPEKILRFSLQISMIEKFEEQMFPFAETGGSPEEILQFGSQMPKLENAVKHMYAVAVDQCNK